MKNAGGHWLCVALGQAALEDCPKALGRQTRGSDWQGASRASSGGCFSQGGDVLSSVQVSCTTQKVKQGVSCKASGCVIAKWLSCSFICSCRSV